MTQDTVQVCMADAVRDGEGGMTSRCDVSHVGMNETIWVKGTGKSDSGSSKSLQIPFSNVHFRISRLGSVEGVQTSGQPNTTSPSEEGH